MIRWVEKEGRRSSRTLVKTDFEQLFRQGYQKKHLYKDEFMFQGKQGLGWHGMGWMGATQTRCNGSADGAPRVFCCLGG